MFVLKKHPSKTLIRTLPKLMLLTQSKNSGVRRALLSDMSKQPKFFKVIKEMVDILQSRQLNITNYKLAKLKKHKKTIKGYGKNKLNDNQKKRLVQQSGGFLPIILPALVTLLTSMLNG